MEVYRTQDTQYKYAYVMYPADYEATYEEIPPNSDEETSEVTYEEFPKNR